MGDRRDFNQLVEGLSETEAQSVVTFVQFLEEGQAPASAAAAEGRAPLLEGAVAIPPSEWRVTLDGFTHVFFDVPCHLWVTTEQGEPRTLGREVPLNEVYFDTKGSEQNSVQVAINRSGTVYGDFRFMHRVADPTAIYLKGQGASEFVDLIIESAGTFTVLEMGQPARLAPGNRSRGFAFPELIKRHEA